MNSNGPRAPRHDPCEVTSGVTMRLQGPHHSAPQAWPAHGRTRDVTPPASSPAAPARSSAGKGPGCEAHSIATAPNVTARCGVEGPHFVTKAPDDRDQPRHMPTRSHGWLWQTVGSAQLTKNVRNHTSCVSPLSPSGEFQSARSCGIQSKSMSAAMTLVIRPLTRFGTTRNCTQRGEARLCGWGLLMAQANFNRSDRAPMMHTNTRAIVWNCDPWGGARPHCSTP